MSSKEYININEGININNIIIVGKNAQTPSKIPECLN